jgi:hypothetical protein
VPRQDGSGGYSAPDVKPRSFIAGAEGQMRRGMEIMRDGPRIYKSLFSATCNKMAKLFMRNIETFA